MSEDREQPETDEERTDRLETERNHATGNHEYCGLTCETEFPSEALRNAILCRAIPGSARMLEELLRRAADPAPDDDEGISGPCDCGEGAVHYTAADCPFGQRRAAEASREHDTDRATQALAEVRRLCEMTIDNSVRVQAVDQARDTLAIIDRVKGKQTAPDREQGEAEW